MMDILIHVGEVKEVVCSVREAAYVIKLYHRGSNQNANNTGGIKVERCPFCGPAVDKPDLVNDSAK